MGSIFDSNVPLDGERATESGHRKVELQSPADLTYLIANVSRAAREKLDKHLPPNAAPDGEDVMRKRVEELLDDYIRNTFNAAKHSMSINGMDSREMETELAKAQEGEEIEPFDTRLAQRIQNLSQQIEQHTLQLATLRRNAPAETSQRFQDSFAKQTETYDAQMSKDEQDRLTVARSTKVDVDEMARLDEMQRSWQRGMEGLVVLKSGLGSTVAKMERAQKAVDEIESK